MKRHEDSEEIILWANSQGSILVEAEAGFLQESKNSRGVFLAKSIMQHRGIRNAGFAPPAAAGASRVRRDLFSMGGALQTHARPRCFLDKRPLFVPYIHM